MLRLQNSGTILLSGERLTFPRFIRGILWVDAVAIVAIIIINAIIIVKMGMYTELGRIAGLIREAGKEDTPLQRNLEVLGKKIVYES